MVVIDDDFDSRRDVRFTSAPRSFEDVALREPELDILLSCGSRLREPESVTAPRVADH